MRESGTSQIGYTEYNKLLDMYRDDVFVAIHKQYHNKIEENSEDYSIEDVISLSYQYLNRWLKAYPLSGHPLDTKLWYDFICKLHLNGEHLPLSDFEKYIGETCNWREDNISRFSSDL